ncbi:hypothetical protein [Streptomyces sp. BE133]|nr:hypothetical protein [Streptomyces sp. BE133]MEE1810017.1 hypothetical protein [Streptomyces sp. BE133]
MSRSLSAHDPRLLAPARLVQSLFVDHPRRGEYEAWRELAERLP